LRRLSKSSREEAQQAFAESLRPLWITLTGFLLVGFFLSFLMEDIPVQSYLDSTGNSMAQKERKAKQSDEKASV
jgi:hypothetical protein